MTLYLALAASSFIFVFLKAFQQRNVTGNNFLLVVPTSLGLATCEVYLVYNMAHAGWALGVVLSIGLAAGVGAVSAMHLHNLIYQENGWLRNKYADLAEKTRERVRRLLGLPTKDD